MGKVLLWMLCLSIAPAGFAGEIVAWKTILSLFVDDGLETEGVVRSPSPPEPSVFFNVGDELWDLNGVSPRHRASVEPPLEWAVWNATTGRLVTKSDWNAIDDLYRHVLAGPPAQLRVLAEIFEVPADGAPLSADSKPAGTLTWITGSDKKFNASTRRGPIEITAEGTAGGDDLSGLIDLRLNAGYGTDTSPGRRFNTSPILMSGEPLWIARDFDGQRGLDFRITATIELPDGTPPSQAILIQKDGQAVPTLPDRSPTHRQEVEGGKVLFSTYVDSFMISLLIRASDGETDLAAPAPNGRPAQRPIDPPPALEGLVNLPMEDLRPVFVKCGALDSDGDSFVAYHPITERLYLLTDDETEFDKVDGLLPREEILSHNVALSFHGDRQLRLVGRSGQISTLTRTASDETVFSSLEIEPNSSDFNTLVELRMEFEETVDETHTAIESSVALPPGIAREVMAGMHATAQVMITKPWKTQDE